MFVVEAVDLFLTSPVVKLDQGNVDRNRSYLRLVIV